MTTMPELGARRTTVAGEEIWIGNRWVPRNMLLTMVHHEQALESDAPFSDHAADSLAYFMNEMQRRGQQDASRLFISTARPNPSTFTWPHGGGSREIESAMAREYNPEIFRLNQLAQLEDELFMASLANRDDGPRLFNVYQAFRQMQNWPDPPVICGMRRWGTYHWCPVDKYDRAEHRTDSALEQVRFAHRHLYSLPQLCEIIVRCGLDRQLKDVPGGDAWLFPGKASIRELGEDNPVFLVQVLEHSEIKVETLYTDSTEDRDRAIQHAQEALEREGFTIDAERTRSLNAMNSDWFIENVPNYIAEINVIVGFRSHPFVELDIGLRGYVDGPLDAQTMRGEMARADRLKAYGAEMGYRRIYNELHEVELTSGKRVARERLTGSIPQEDMRCEECGGEGRNQTITGDGQNTPVDFEDVDCLRCNGTGRHPVENWIMCPTCNGAATTNGHSDCEECGGLGEVVDNRRYDAFVRGYQRDGETMDQAAARLVRTMEEYTEYPAALRKAEQAIDENITFIDPENDES